MARAARALRLWVAAWASLLPPLPALADYDPQPQDVLEISVAGAPALDRRVAVAPDGTIVLPVVGAVPVEGSLGDLKRRLEALLAAKNVIRNPDVEVSVAEYGPIYVSGDVVKPGEYRFRPGMTVANAIALAGGYDVQQNEQRSTPAQVAYARGEFGAAAIEYARQAARAARIRAELAGADAFEVPADAKRSVDPAVLTDILGIENRQLQADRDSDAKQAAYLDQMVKAAQDHVAALDQAEQASQLTYEQQARDASRSRELLQKSIGTVARAEETQRAQLQSQSQVMDVRVRAVQARTDLQERQRNIATSDEQRRGRLLEALQQAVAQAATARQRKQAAYDEMTLRTGAGSRQSATSASAIVRRRGSKPGAADAADLGTELRSGDSVEVVLGPSSFAQQQGAPSAAPFQKP